MSLSEDIAELAESIVNGHTHTEYQHVEKIDADAGVYDCDCNSFVSYVVNVVAPQQYSMVPKESGQSRPRAFEYFDYFASLTPESSGGWARVDKLEDARRGDVMAWRFPTIKPHEDTGHVMFLADSPSIDDSGEFVRVRIYDSAAAAHFDDTRMPDGQASPRGATGVGSGFIHLRTDGEGRPIGYLFAPPDDAQYAYRPIAIGRPEPV